MKRGAFIASAAATVVAAAIPALPVAEPLVGAAFVPMTMYSNALGTVPLMIETLQQAWLLYSTLELGPTGAAA